MTMTVLRLLSVTLMSLLTCCSAQNAFAQQAAGSVPPPAAANAAPAIKVAEKPIPSFTVWQLRAGESTESQVTPVQLNPAGYWLMLYVDASSKTSLDLLAQVQTLAQTPALDRTGAVLQAASAGNGAAPVPQYKLDAGHLVIVVTNATGAQLGQFKLAYAGLAAASWARDSGGAAAKALGIRGTPHLFGMREDQERWQLPGNLSAHDTEPVLTSWQAMNRLPANKLVRHKVAPAAAKTSAAPVPASSSKTPTAQAPSR